MTAPLMPARARRGAAHFVLPAFALSALLASPALLAQEDETESAGFSADSVYSVEDLDTVDLFGGGLTLAIPIGGEYPVSSHLSYRLTLIYNVKLWNYSTVVTGYDQGVPIHATVGFPDRTANAGFGWRLDMGFLLPPNPNAASGFYLDRETWRYVSPDGARHYFYDQLHEGEIDGSAETRYARDNTYLRFQEVSGGPHTVEFPNGEKHSFGYWDESLIEPRWRLTRMEDRFGNWVRIDYVTLSETERRWTISDVHGRYHTITTLKSSATQDWAITQADLEAFGGERAIYTFSYADVTIPQGCEASSGGTVHDVRFLTQVQLPDQSAYEMLKGPNDSPRYVTTATCGDYEGDSGALEGIRLRTRGQIEWGYGRWMTPQTNDRPGSPHSPVRPTRGVVERRTLDADDDLLGTWRYTRELYPPAPWAEGSKPQELRTHVMGSTGGELPTDCTLHYFDANPGYVSIEDTNPAAGWSYGLPFSWENPVANGTYLSTEVFNGRTGDLCSGNVVRTTAVGYAHDTLPPLEEDWHGRAFQVWHDTNRRVEATRTIYDDDGGRYAETTFSDFDGLGHYRTATTGGDFAAGNDRITTTDFSLTGTPAPLDAWILNTFTERTVTEGGQTLKEEFCFDLATGFLEKHRILGGALPADTDIFVRYLDDDPDNPDDDALDGNLGLVRYFGGKDKGFSGTDVCSLSGSGAAYVIGHTWSYGTVATSAYRQGATEVLRFVNRAIDKSTGLVASSTDTSGITTSFDYDELGRLEQELPPGGEGAQVDYIYTPAGSEKAQVKVVRKANPGGGELARKIVVFDDLGRVFEEKRLLPDGGLPGDSLNLRQTLYNERGWKRSVSEVEAEVETPAHLTTFKGYDPFGRPTTIVPSDGTAHKVTLTYTGVSQVSRTVAIAGSDGEFDSTTTETYDRQGRLQQVLEPIGLEGQTTTYEYDAGNRLKKVSASDGTTTQVREFEYDGRGFLVSETHPEMELLPLEQRSVVYEDYDARGHAGEKTDTSRTLFYTYDRAERLSTVRQAHDPEPLPLKEFVYGTTGRANGKLVSATRHNYIPEGTGFGGADFQVVETYAYDGTGGRISERRIQRQGSNQFTQSFAWTDLGELETLTYPSCWPGAPCSAMGAPVRVVTHGYEAGFLTSVREDPSISTTVYAPLISYHANEMLATVVHTDDMTGITDVWEADLNGMRRPRRIRTENVATGAEGGNFDTGTYSYDGAGNIAAMGNDVFHYDGVSRLASSAVTFSGVPYTQSQSYDGFGNRVSVSGPDGVQLHPTDPATNRLQGSPEVPVSYDGAGNLTSRGQTTYTYDALNMLLRVEAPNASPGPVDHVFIYTADDERIVVIDFDAPALANLWYLRDHDGQLVRQLSEVDQPSGPHLWSWTRDTIRRDGQLLATETPGGPAQLLHYHLDHLGTPRLLTKGDRTVSARHNLLPFGEEPSPPSATQPFRFTGHERDEHGMEPALCGDPPGPCLDYETVDGVLSGTERHVAGIQLTAGPADVTVAAGADVTFRAGDTVVISGNLTVEAGAELVVENASELEGVAGELDYMHARYCSPGLGRFLSVDPAGESADPRKPQSWNRYSYVQNRPLSFIDPTGEILFFFSSSTADLEELEQLANEDLFGVDLVIGHTGEASLVANDEFEPPTPEQAAFADVLQTAIDSTSNIGLNVTRNSSQALVGNRVGEIDIADMAMLQGTITGFAGALAHEVAEQSFLQTIDPRLTEGQVLARTSPTRPEHLAGIAAQSAVAGAQRIRTTRTGQLRVTDFAGGKTVRFIVRNGNIIKVIK